MADGREGAEPTRRERPRHRFPPLEKRGVIAGWRGGQIAAVAVSLVLAVLLVRSRPSVGGIAGALVGVVLGLALAFWPIRGRTGEQWLPLVVRWAWSASLGDRLQLAPGPRRGHLATVAGIGRGPAASGDGPAVVTVPRASGGRGVFDGITLTSVPCGPDSGDRPMGMILDTKSRTATVVLSVRGHNFALLGPADQDSRVAAWARVLSTLAREGSDVHRIQWVESSLPDDGGAVHRYCDSRAVLGAESPAGRSYRSLVAQAAPTTRQHRLLVTLSLHLSRSSRAVRAVGGGAAGAGVLLARELRSLERALEAAEAEVEGVVGPVALARWIGTALSPSGSPGPADQGPTDSPPDEPSPHWPWPMAVDPRWDSVRTDGTWHATYWIAEWPRVDVGPDFLGPLFFLPCRRSIAVTMEPVSPSRAARQVAQSRTAELADGELRRRGGFLVTARQTREKQSIDDRDVELADGHAQYRFSGYVTVTADSQEALVQARGAVEQAAGQARIELRLLYGEQDAAFTCSLPLGRGLS